jgi:mevalonate kinase
MDTKGTSFPAKILLFGEYTILLGSSAFSIPYHAYTATLAFPGNGQPTSSRKQITSNHRLLGFYQYLDKHGARFSQIIDLERFHKDLKQGLFLQSTIPPGYGLGSSGALVAAIHHRFARCNSLIYERAGADEMIRLKSELSELESFFHGKSSGFDPTVSLLKRPLVLRSDGVPELTNLPHAFSAGSPGIFLLDTGQAGKTAPLVKQFLEIFKPEGQVSEEGKSLTGIVDHLVSSFLDFSDEIFWDLMKKFSIIQIEKFKPMIPGNYVSIWSEGIESRLFYLKLCGSGGGGFLTGFTPDLKKAISYLKNRCYCPIVVPVH